ncbi:MAG: DLW-39 family protein, partial [Corynebacterium variabile]|nr:DLW-39 family protein [Corynebacterium variabile]
MKKWIATLSAVGAAAAIGLVIRQIGEDLSTNAELWRSVTD